jgi:hypothetical protein
MIKRLKINKMRLALLVGLPALLSGVATTKS